MDRRVPPKRLSPGKICACSKIAGLEKGMVIRMIVYGLLLTLLAALALIQTNKTEDNVGYRTGYRIGKRNDLALLISCFSIYLLMILKAPLAGDYSRYAYNFLNSVDRTIKFYWDRKEDSGFYILTKMIGEINYSTVFYFAVTSAIICISLFFFIKRYASNKRYAIYFYFTIGLFAFSLAGLRQALAMSICLFAYEAAKRRKIIPFLLIVGVAYLLHKSALFFLPVFFVGWVPWKAKYHLVVLTAYGIIGLFFHRFYAIITNWMGYDYDIESTRNGGIFLLILLIIGFLGIVYRKKLLERDQGNLFFLNMHFVVIMMWVFRMFTRTAERPTFYYLYASIILLDRILDLKMEGEEEKARKIMVLSSVFFFGLFFLYRTIRDRDLIPYISIFH